MRTKKFQRVTVPTKPEGVYRDWGGVWYFKVTVGGNRPRGGMARRRIGTPVEHRNGS